MKIKHLLKYKIFIPCHYMPMLMLCWIILFCYSIPDLCGETSPKFLWRARLSLSVLTLYMIAALLHYRRGRAGSKTNRVIVESPLFHDYKYHDRAVVELNGKSFTVINGKIVIPEEEKEMIRALFKKLYSSEYDPQAPAFDFFKKVIKELGFREYHYICNLTLYSEYTMLFAHEMSRCGKENDEGDVPAPGESPHGTDRIHEVPPVKSAQKNEHSNARQNRQSLVLLFEDMDRTMFINRHNLRLNTSTEWNAKETFWYEFYDEFINNTLKRLYLDENFDKIDRDVLRKKLKQGARCVYDLNNPLLSEKAGLEKLKARGMENDPVAYVKNLMSVYAAQENRESSREPVSLDFKDSLLNRLEGLIDDVFDNPDEVRKQVDYHWSEKSLRSFQRQLGPLTSYSREGWMSAHPAEWIEDYR